MDQQAEPTNDAPGEVDDLPGREPDVEASESPSTAPFVDAPDDDRADIASEAELRRALEALVCVTETPADPALLAQVLEISPEVVDRWCRELATSYEDEGRGFQLVRVAGGWRMQSAPSTHTYVERFIVAGQSSRLSAAALETLAIVAYKQPVSRAQVAAIRGVNADGVMRTLAQRGYIAEIARDTGPGAAGLFGTTALFLERLGLDSVADLPKVADFVPGADVVEALEAGLRFDDELFDA